METVKLSTIISFFDPKLKELLTPYELQMAIVLKGGIDSVTTDDMLEIIEASIFNKENGALLIQ